MKFMIKPLVAGMAAAAITFGFANTASAQTTTIKVSHQFPGGTEEKAISVTDWCASLRVRLQKKPMAA